MHYLASSRLRRSVSLLLCGLAALTATASAQTIITSVPYNISASGSYTLAGNLNHSNVGTPAITINAPNVILDLNGYYVAGPGNPASSVSVIRVGNFANVTVKNGTVAGAGRGIDYTATDSLTTSRNYVVDKVTITRCYAVGIYFGVKAPGSLVKNCSFSTIGNSTVSTNTSPCAIISSGGVRIEKNNLNDVTPTGTGVSYGINGSPSDFAIGNTIANCTYGIIAAKYLNNLTYNVTTPFNGTSASGNN